MEGEALSSACRTAIACLLGLQAGLSLGLAGVAQAAEVDAEEIELRVRIDERRDEMVRTLKPQVLRRAVVPAKFDLDRGTRSTYPREAPPGTTYLEVNIRRVLASNAVGVCDGATDETSLQAAKVATPLCASGRTEKYGMFEVDLDRVPGGRPTNDFSDL